MHAHVYATLAGQKYNYLSSSIATANYLPPCERRYSSEKIIFKKQNNN